VEGARACVPGPAGLLLLLFFLKKPGAWWGLKLEAVMERLLAFETIDNAC
jgi:hypothetical protein